MVDQVDVKIVGDASQATGAAVEVGSAWERAGVVMREAFARLGISARESFGQVGAAATLAGEKVSAAATVATGASERMKLAAEGARGAYERVGHGLEVMNKAFIAVAAVMAGGAIFKEAVSATNHLTADVIRLSKGLGITLTEASGLHAAMSKFGISTDTVAAAGQKLARQLKMNEAAMNGMGIQTRDADGHFRNLREIMFDGIERLKGYKEGTDRTMASQVLFGRGAGDVASLLKLSNEEMAEGEETAKRLGLVVGTEGVAAYKRYQVAQNEMKETFEAVQVAIGNAVLPALVEFGDWLKENGAAAVEKFREAIDALVKIVSAVGTVWHSVMSVVIEFTSSVGEVIADVFGRKASAAFLSFDNWIAAIQAAVVGFRTMFVVAMEALVNGISLVINSLRLLGAVAADVFTMNWGQIGADWDAGTKRISDSAIKHSRRIRDEMAKANAEMAALQAPKKPAREPAAGSDSILTGTDTFTPSAKGGKSGPKNEGGKAFAPDRLSDWENQLEQRRLALDKLNDAENTFREMSKGEEADYWQAILDRGGLSTKERQQVEAKYLAATLASKKEGFEALIAAERTEMAEAKANGQKRIDLAQLIENQIAHAYGANSKEAEAAKRERIRTEQEVGQERVRTAQAAAQRIADADLWLADMEEQAAQHRAEMGRETQGQLIRDEQRFEDQRYEIRLAALRAQLQALALSPLDSPEAKRTLDEKIEQLERQHQQKMGQLRGQAELQATARTRNGIQGVSSAWGQALSRMATLQAGFGSTIKSLWQGITGAISGALAEVIQNYISRWITAMAIKHGLMKADQMAGVSAEVAKAGAGGVASMAAAPFPLNMGAPGFGAAMAAAAAAFGAVPQYAVGAWELPSDHLAQVHKGEMIIPRPFAEDLRANGSMGGGHTFNGPVIMGDLHAIDTQSSAQFLMRNKHHVVAAAASGYRDGSRPRVGR